jgi:hypothetical protein
LCSAWGNDPRYEVCDVRVKLQALGSNFLFHPAASVPPDSMSSASTPIRSSRRPMGSSGSAAIDQSIFGVPHPAKASSTLRLQHEPVKLPDRAASRTPTRPRSEAVKPRVNYYSVVRHLHIPGLMTRCHPRSAAQWSVTVTAPTVRLPLRTMANRPCSRSSRVSTASGSSTRALFR